MLAGAAVPAAAMADFSGKADDTLMIQAPAFFDRVLLIGIGALDKVKPTVAEGVGGNKAELAGLGDLGGDDLATAGGEIGDGRGACTQRRQPMQRLMSSAYATTTPSIAGSVPTRTSTPYVPL